MKRLLLTILTPLLALTLSTSMIAANAATANKSAAAKHVFRVLGMSCPFCAVGIKKTFKKVKGVQSVDVSFKSSTVTVKTNKGICFSNKELKSIFGKTGFSYDGTIVKPKGCK